MPLDQSVLDSISNAAVLIKKSSYVIALTGAGVSVESGIPPFRGPGGLWTKYGEPPMDGYQRFLENPRQYWTNMLNPDRRSRFGFSLDDAEPNSGHRAIAELEHLGIVKMLVTQNIDDLHNQAGSTNLLEIHGNRKLLRCVDCESRYPKGSLDLTNLPPKCPNCGGVVKDDVVMFGEPIPRSVLSRCFNEAKKSDCILVVGTSATVTPAASLPLIVKRNNGIVIEVNPRESELTELCGVCIRASSGEAMPELVKVIKQLV